MASPPISDDLEIEVWEAVAIAGWGRDSIAIGEYLLTFTP